MVVHDPRNVVPLGVGRDDERRDAEAILHKTVVGRLAGLGRQQRRPTLSGAIATGGGTWSK